MKLPLRGAPLPDVLSKPPLICLGFPEAHEEASLPLKESFRALAPAGLAALVE